MVDVELEDAVLRVLSTHRGNRLTDDLTSVVNSELPGHRQVTISQVHEVIWGLVAQRLIYLNHGDHAARNWYLSLTTAGTAQVLGETVTPDTPDRFLHRLSEHVPTIGPVVVRYMEEAVGAYVARRYLASAVMVGVASEAAFYDMVAAFGAWLPDATRARFERRQASLTSFNSRFRDWRNELEKHGAAIPIALKENRAVFLDGVLNQIRIFRNEAGHPTGLLIGREDAFTNLQLVPRYMARLYGYKHFFENHVSQAEREPDEEQT